MPSAKDNTKSANTPAGLVGRAFHTIKDTGHTNWQGTVLADLGGGCFLVQLYDWFGGFPSTQHVLHISQFHAMTEDGTPRFRFFDSMDAANSYMDNFGSARDDAIAKQRGQA
jgi:hypothetical protein